ncbi:MAG: hypothetical protein ACK41C_08665 [Phenylobacterium sp.]|uniref:hypothetical protein n=1 Tax=Phenylobacterium sp. TaxID=1871053 RepID=UPI003918AE9B
MSLPITLGLLVAFAALALFAGWRGARPPDLSKGPRMAPWRLIMLTAAMGAVLMVVHAVNLLGVQTGRF